MKILLSPAKALDFENCPSVENTSTPKLLENSSYLIGKLKKLSPKKISKLMSISDDLGQLNYERFHSFTTPFTEQNSKPAGFVFNGEAYRGLDAKSLSTQDLNNLNEKLRILSGLYGVLKPLDLIQPYRLEMGTRFQVTSTKTNLYKYWGDTITEMLNEELEDNEVVVNVASAEYFKSVNGKRLKGEVISCNFKENKGGTYKPVMVFAKRARGMMARFIVQNGIENKEELKAFDIDGYAFNNSLSSESEYIFTRG